MTVSLPRPEAHPLSQLDVPVGSVDVLPRLAAGSWPTRAALRTGTRTLTFAELDRDISRLAFGLRQLIGGDGLTVALSATLGVDFPKAFYAIARSGNVSVPVNPRMPADAFAQLLAVTKVRAAILDRAMYERVRPVLAATPLEQVVLLDAPVGASPVTCAELSTGGGLLVEPRDRDENEPAAVVFGHGLSHHELKAGAVRRARTDGLTGRSIVLNAMAAYHPTHLGAAVSSGATQVLWRSPDQSAAAREARHVGATHLLSGSDRNAEILTGEFSQVVA
jgi:acyl-CoA synthetase (AMP-forming)/AMP-acid ligase II